MDLKLHTFVSFVKPSNNPTHPNNNLDDLDTPPSHLISFQLHLRHLSQEQMATSHDQGHQGQRFPNLTNSKERSTSWHDNSKKDLNICDDGIYEIFRLSCNPKIITVLWFSQEPAPRPYPEQIKSSPLQHPNTLNSII